MRCSNCGTELRPEARFCTTCGAGAGRPTATAPHAPTQPVATYGDAARQPLSGTGQPRKKSGCAKAFVVLLIIGLLALVGVGVAAYFGYYALEGKLKSSEPYALAVSALKENPAVVEKLGEVKETGFPLGSFNEDASGSGAAAFHMSVKGTKTTGQYNVVLARRAGKWYLTTGRLTLASGETINVRSSLEGLTGDDANANANGGGIAPPPPPGRSGSNVNAVSGGVLEGKVTSKPEPAYPQIAKAAKASGTVVVQVTVDEKGQVMDAQAVSGHPLLRAAAAAAARQASFTPTLLAGKPVKVRGTISYNFVLE